MADETVYVSHQEIQDIRWKADHRDQPGVLYRGQRIIGFREWMEGDVYSYPDASILTSANPPNIPPNCG